VERPQSELEELKRVYSRTLVGGEANVPYYLISDVGLPEHCNPRVVDVLLCPVEQAGYPSRMYFSQRIDRPPHPDPNRRLNWTGVMRVMERNWNVLSWRVGAGINQRLLQMVAAHLEPFQ
jgi:hypothetical protein